MAGIVTLGSVFGDSLKRIGNKVPEAYLTMRDLQEREAEKQRRVGLDADEKAWREWQKERYAKQDAAKQDADILGLFNNHLKNTQAMQQNQATNDYRNRTLSETERHNRAMEGQKPQGSQPTDVLGKIMDDLYKAKGRATSVNKQWAQTPGNYQINRDEYGSEVGRSTIGTPPMQNPLFMDSFKRETRGMTQDQIDALIWEAKRSGVNMLTKTDQDMNQDLQNQLSQHRQQNTSVSKEDALAELRRRGVIQ